MRVWRGAVLALGALVAGAACSDEAPAATTVSPTAAPTAGCPSQDDPPLAVDQIDDALTALAAEVGEAAQLFEVNATDVVVNLFVAGTAADGASTVTPYAFARGELVGEAPAPAEGATFAADAVRLDPSRVLSCVAAEVPDATFTGFVVEGGPGGSVRFTVVVSSSQGGQLLAEVTGDGRVVSVQVV